MSYNFLKIRKNNFGFSVTRWPSKYFFLANKMRLNHSMVTWMGFFISICPTHLNIHTLTSKWVKIVSVTTLLSFWFPCYTVNVEYSINKRVLGCNKSQNSSNYLWFHHFQQTRSTHDNMETHGGFTRIFEKIVAKKAMSQLGAFIYVITHMLSVLKFKWRITFLVKKTKTKTKNKNKNKKLKKKNKTKQKTNKKKTCFLHVSNLLHIFIFRFVLIMIF